MDVAMKRPVKWTLVFLAAFLGLAGTILGPALLRARAVLQEQMKDAESILSTFLPEPTSRPAIFDPEEPGNAWELENAAFRDLDPDSPWDPDMHNDNRHMFVGAESFSELPEDQDVVKLEPFIEVFRLALRRRNVIPAKRPGLFAAHSVQEIAGRLVASAQTLHRDGKDLQAAERLVMAVGLIQDVARHGDYAHLDALLYVEHRSASVAWEILSAHSLSATDLETWAKWMDRLQSARPSLARIISVDAALSRKDVLEEFANVARYPSNPGPDLTATWRDLWSKSLLKSHRVLAINRAARDLTERAGRPPWLMGPQEDFQADEWSLEVPDARLLEVNAASLLYLLLWRVSIALAWYESERGEYPKLLTQLSPRYLPQEPVSPRTGKALEYQTGSVGSDPGPGDTEKVTVVGGLNPDLFHWKVGRKPQ